MTHRSDSAVGQDRSELRDECTAGPMQQSAAHGETAADVAMHSPRRGRALSKSSRQPLTISLLLFADCRAHETPSRTAAMRRHATAAAVSRLAKSTFAFGLMQRSGLGVM